MHVAVVGGGLSGLVAAYDLVSGGATVSVFEASSLLGGQVRTRREDGYVVEDGAEGFVATDREVPALCEAIGLNDQIVAQLERRSLLLQGGRLTTLPPARAAALLGIQAQPDDLGRGIASLRDGMGALAEKLGLCLDRAGVRVAAAVTKLERRAGRWRVESRPGPQIEADQVIVATPPPAAADLLESLAPGPARILRSIKLMSNVSVSLAYLRPAVAHPLDASGFVVAPDDPSTEGLRACAFCSSKFPNRAPGGRVLLRGFFRPEQPHRSAAKEWESRAARVFAEVLKIGGPPFRGWTAAWPSALPLYSRDHGDRMNQLREELQSIGSIELAGSAYDPGGIPGAVRSGRQAARRVLDS